MRIFLLRHAEPAWSVDGRFEIDPGLTARGRRQAAALADLDWPPDAHLLVSPSRRARETAAPLARRLGSEPAIAPWSEELRSPPEWQTTPADAVARALAAFRDRPIEDWWEGFPTGESFRDFHRRVTEGLRGTLADHGIVRRDGTLWDVPDHAGDLIVVAHGGTNSVILGELLGIEPVPWEWERFAAPHASVAEIASVRLGGGHIFSLRRFGDVGHLDEITF